MSTKRTKTLAAAGLAAGLLFGGGAQAQTCLVDVLGIAVTEPVAQTADAQRMARDIATAVAERLEADALFARIPDSVFPQSAQDIRGRPAWNDWRRVRTDVLMTGETVLLSDGQYEFRFRLWDVRFSREIANYVLTAPASDWGRVADLVHSTLIERGVDIAATRCRPPEGERASPFRRLTA